MDDAISIPISLYLLPFRIKRCFLLCVFSGLVTSLIARGIAKAAGLIVIVMGKINGRIKGIITITRGTRIRGNLHSVPSR